MRNISEMTRKGDYQFLFREQSLTLTPEKAIFWNNRNSLLISDLHIGKAGHFRKHGIPVPKTLNDNNLNRLTDLVEHFNPTQIFILGDLFHSEENNEWRAFEKWRVKYKHIDMFLAIGNHDFHPIEKYESIGLKCFKEIKAVPFLLNHDLEDLEDLDSLYPISGHIHPSIKIKGGARQSIRFPCFFFGDSHGLIPAFGAFTGTHNITAKSKDKVFAIVEDQIVPIS